MHANRAIHLTTPTKQAAECQVQLHGIRIDLDQLHQHFGRLVGLFVQEVVETLTIGGIELRALCLL